MKTVKALVVASAVSVAMASAFAQPAKQPEPKVTPAPAAPAPAAAAPAAAAPAPTKKAETPKAADPADYVSPITAEAVREKAPEQKIVDAVSTSEPAAKIDSIDVSGLRRMWPEVIENVKKRRRLTWSLLSASAQILGVDDMKRYILKDFLDE
jgi:hypothetical protein